MKKVSKVKPPKRKPLHDSQGINTQIPKQRLNNKIKSSVENLNDYKQINKQHHHRAPSANVAQAFETKINLHKHNLPYTEMPIGDIDEIQGDQISPKNFNNDNTPHHDSRDTHETSQGTASNNLSITCVNSSYDSANLECNETIMGEIDSQIFCDPENIRDSDLRNNINFKKETTLHTIDLEEETKEKDTSVFGEETMNYLISREIYYMPDPFYLEKMQPFLSPNNRAMLIDWMMEVASEFGMKRETFHCSVNYIDRYLEKVPKVTKEQFQLLGATALNISCKLEEVYSRKLEDFLQATDNSYSLSQLINMELKMLVTLNFEITLPSLNMWGNWYICYWDYFVQNNSKARSMPDNFSTLKSSNSTSYKLFREFMQIIDATTLDIVSLQYKPRAIIASALYLVNGMKYFNISPQQLFDDLKSKTFQITESEYSEMFNEFLDVSFGFSLDELIPTIEYLISFLLLSFEYEPPNSSDSKYVVDDSNMEEFYSMMMHNKSQLSLVSSFSIYQ